MPQKSNAPDAPDRSASIPQEQDDELELAEDDEELDEDEDFDEDDEDEAEDDVED